MPPEKDKETSLSPEISRLSAVLARDPSSKLFMPLAEEYMKVMMVEEAIMTLEDGLKSNPFYMSARVLLGKAYAEKGNLDEALSQFEQVVKTIPDNLLAHRMLGMIYKSQGRYQEAIRSYRMISILNPKDEEVQTILKELESGKAAPEKIEPEEKTEFRLESHRAEPQQAAEPVPQKTEVPVFDLAETETPEAADEEVLEEPPMISESFEVPEPEEEGKAVLDMPILEMDTIESVKSPVEAEEFDTLNEEASPQEPESVVELDWEGGTSAELGTDEPVAAGGSGYAVDLKAAVGLDDIFASYEGGVQEQEETTSENRAGVYEISDELSSFNIDVFKPEQALDEPVVTEEARAEEPSAEPFETETLAELYISQGFYDRAIGIYKNLLVEDPGNNQIRQKLEDLYQLAGISSSKAAGKVEMEDIAAPESEPFAGLDEEPAGIIWELPAEEIPEEQPAEEAQPIKMPVIVDTAAVKRLEQFLTNIRKKAGR